jgi:hypothetical protein
MQALPDNSLVVLMGGKVKYMSNRTCILSFLSPVRSHQAAIRDIVRRLFNLSQAAINPRQVTSFVKRPTSGI